MIGHIRGNRHGNILPSLKYSVKHTMYRISMLGGGGEGNPPPPPKKKKKKKGNEKSLHLKMDQDVCFIFVL